MLPIEFQETVLEPAKEYRPSFKLSYREADEFLRAFQKAAEGQGIIPDSTARNEGLLKATEYHLEDMRKLVFKDIK